MSYTRQSTPEEEQFLQSALEQADKLRKYGELMKESADKGKNAKVGDIITLSDGSKQIKTGDDGASQSRTVTFEPYPQANTQIATSGQIRNMSPQQIQELMRQNGAPSPQTSQKVSGQDRMTMYANSFFASEAGQELIQSLFKEDDDLFKDIKKRVDFHNSYVNGKNKSVNKQVALGDDESLINSIRIPKNINPPVNPYENTQPGFPNTKKFLS